MTPRRRRANNCLRVHDADYVDTVFDLGTHQPGRARLARRRHRHESRHPDAALRAAGAAAWRWSW
jgi:acetoin utilization deacetylase AcuC-like enzyme